MTQFTQLNLNGKPDPKPTVQAPKTEPQRPASTPKTNNNKNNHKPKTLTIIGSAVALALMGVALLETSGCSKANKTAVSTATPQPSIQPTTSAPAPVAAPEPIAQKTVKKPVRAKIPTATYKNAEYNLSFRYPKYDSLKEGDDAKMEWVGIGPVPMNFSQPGGTTLSAVELPNGLYPGTDFASGFFNASVASNVTAEQCAQFSSDSSVTDKASASKVKIGKAEFMEMETLAGDSKQADAKYYHLFQNNNCYEFTLGIQTASDKADDDVTPVNRNQVFHKLEWILSTVKVDSPATTAATASAATSGAVAVASPESTPVKVIDDRQ